MSYRVTVVSGNSYDIKVTTKQPVSSVDVTGTAGIESLSQVGDVNSSNRQDNYFLMWDQATQKHIYVSPSEILDRSDGSSDGTLNYGSY